MIIKIKISKNSAISTKNGIPPAIAPAARKMPFSMTRSPTIWPRAFIRLTIMKKPTQTAVIEAIKAADSPGFVIDMALCAKKYERHARKTAMISEA